MESHLRRFEYVFNPCAKIQSERDKLEGGHKRKYNSLANYTKVMRPDSQGQQRCSINGGVMPTSIEPSNERSKVLSSLLDGNTEESTNYNLPQETINTYNFSNNVNQLMNCDPVVRRIWNPNSSLNGKRKALNWPELSDSEVCHQQFKKLIFTRNVQAFKKDGSNYTIGSVVGHTFQLRSKTDKFCSENTSHSQQLEDHVEISAEQGAEDFERKIYEGRILELDENMTAVTPPALLDETHLSHQELNRVSDEPDDDSYFSKNHIPSTSAAVMYPQFPISVSFI